MPDVRPQPSTQTTQDPGGDFQRPNYASAGALLHRRQTQRMLLISLMGIVVGIAGGLVAEGLLRAINFISNVCFYGKATSANLPPNLAVFHWWTPLLPAAGGLLVGLLIRYFSPEIKGDGIPEAMSVA